MPNFIDRRLNPKDKSLGNRQRFLRRARAQIKEVVNQSLKDRSISDIDGGQTVTIPTKGIGEPRFHQASDRGHQERVFTGNREFLAGDHIDKPKGGGAGQGGSNASDSGDGDDEFQFALSREEFLDLFFEDLELPDLVKTNLKDVQSTRSRRAGFAVSGTPTNINLARTMRNSFARRIALRRPKGEAVEAIEREIEDMTEKSDLRVEDVQRLKGLWTDLEALQRRRRAIPYIDPFDIRYNRFEPQPIPSTSAVMFCLMDVSGSMGQREKDLAKRFFVMLHLFLKRRYKKIEIVFIRHTHEAQEVDEETFFYSRETGGTVVSSALDKMLEIVRDRYPTRDWNIYAAQASDGDNFPNDSDNCVALLGGELMPLVQYYAYVEILDEREMDIFQDPEQGTRLWQAYRKVGQDWVNFQMKRIGRPADIYPVFRELFAKQAKDEAAPTRAKA